MENPYLMEYIFAMMGDDARDFVRAGAVCKDWAAAAASERRRSSVFRFTPYPFAWAHSSECAAWCGPTTLAVAFKDDVVRVFDAGNGTLVNSIDLASVGVRLIHSIVAALGASSPYLCIGDASLHTTIVGLDGAPPILRVSTPDPILNPPGVASNGRLVAMQVGIATVRVVELGGGGSVTTQFEHDFRDGEVRFMDGSSFNPAGDRLAVNLSCSIRIFDVATGDQLYSIRPINSPVMMGEEVLIRNMWLPSGGLLLNETSTYRFPLPAHVWSDGRIVDVSDRFARMVRDADDITAGVAAVIANDVDESYVRVVEITDDFAIREKGKLWGKPGCSITFAKFSPNGRAVAIFSAPPNGLELVPVR